MDFSQEVALTFIALGVKAASLCRHCAAGIAHHTNAAGSIGGGDRHVVWDIHAVDDPGGVGLAECSAYDEVWKRFE